MLTFLAIPQTPRGRLPNELTWNKPALDQQHGQAFSFCRQGRGAPGWAASADHHVVGTSDRNGSLKVHLSRFRFRRVSSGRPGTEEESGARRRAEPFDKRPSRLVGHVAPFP